MCKDAAYSIMSLRKVECFGCGYPKAVIYVDKKYHGLRSKCAICGSNWPES